MIVIGEGAAFISFPLTADYAFVLRKPFMAPAPAYLS